jgi:hypothetical protein
MVEESPAKRWKSTANISTAGTQMPLKISQTALLAAMREADLGWKWWEAELGFAMSRFSEYQNGTRPMPEDRQQSAFAKLAEKRPDLAASLVQAAVGAYGISVGVTARPEPNVTSRRCQNAVVREFADLATAWADADEDGHHNSRELTKRLREIREMREALATYETVTAQELATVGQAELVNK